MNVALQQVTQAAILRRRRMKMAELITPIRKVQVIEPVTIPTHMAIKIVPNETPDDLLNARRYVRKYPTTAEIIQSTSLRFGIPAHDIMSQRKTNEIIFARHAVYWLCRECTPMSLLQIGFALGKRDHTTIIHGIKKTEERIATRCPEDVARFCLILRDQLQGPQPAPFWGS